MLGMENHDFLIDIDRMLPIVEAVDPWFGVNFDSGNIAPTSNLMNWPHRSLFYKRSDQSRDSQTEKEYADLARIITILQNANYRDTVLEYEGGEDPYKAIPGYRKLQT